MQNKEIGINGPAIAISGPMPLLPIPWKNFHPTPSNAVIAIRGEEP